MDQNTTPEEPGNESLPAADPSAVAIQDAARYAWFCDRIRRSLRSPIGVGLAVAIGNCYVLSNFDFNAALGFPPEGLNGMHVSELVALTEFTRRRIMKDIERGRPVTTRRQLTDGRVFEVKVQYVQVANTVYRLIESRPKLARLLSFLVAGSLGSYFALGLVI